MQTPSTAVRVRAIAHFACSPRCSHYDPSHSFSCLAFFPHLAVFSYLALCPYFAFFSPSYCLLLYCLRSIPTSALFPYSIFDSLPIETSVLSESRRDGATASHSSLISCSEPSSPSHTQHAYSIIHPHPIFLSDPNPSDPVNVHWLTDGTGFPGARSQQRYRSLMRRLAEAGRHQKEYHPPALRQEDAV